MSTVTVTPLRIPRPTVRRGALYIGLVAVGLVVGALSLLRSTALTYDPWCWVIWGREIFHGHLQLRGGPSWKPLPVIFTTVFAAFGSAAPLMWLAVARAGLVVAILMIFRVTTRLVWQLTRGQLGQDAPGWAVILAGAPAVVGGLAAVAGFLLSSSLLHPELTGYSEGLLTAATLIALERATDGHPRQAFAIGAIVALDRPEISAVWLPYGAWLMWRDPQARRLVVGIVLAVLALWLLPEGLGNSSFTSSIARARAPRTWIQRQQCPFCADVTHYIWPRLPDRIRWPALFPLLAVPVWWMWRSRGDGARRALSSTERAFAAWGGLAAAGAGWWLVIALEAQAGFSGSIRYLILGTAFMYISGGIGYGFAAAAAANLIARRHLVPRPLIPILPVGTALVAALILVLVPTWPKWLAARPATLRESLVYNDSLQAELRQEIHQAGGAAYLRRCGRIVSEFYELPLTAWLIGVPLNQVKMDPTSARERGLPPPTGGGPAPNVVIQDRPRPGAPFRPTHASMVGWIRQRGHWYTAYRGIRLNLYVGCR